MQKQKQPAYVHQMNKRESIIQVKRFDIRTTYGKSVNGKNGCKVTIGICFILFPDYQ